LKANDFTVESLDWVCFSDLGIVGAYLVVIARLGTGVEIDIDIDVENIFERNIPLRERYECPL
jgi:hypothetical protein